jgi:hypothetical protein
LINDRVYTKTFSINTIQPVSCNIDPDRVKTDSGVEDSRTPILINSLDLKLINQSCIYPKLNPDIINQAATNNSTMRLIILRKSLCENAEPSVYTIKVTY